MRYLLCFFICFLGLLAFGQLQNNIPEDDAELSRIIDETALYPKSKYNLELVGTGISCPGGVFLSQGLSFDIKQQLTKDECREVLYDLATRMKDTINASEILVGIMKSPPFTLKNIKINIFFKNSDGRDPIDPDWAVVSLSYGKYRFRTNDPNKEFSYKINIEEDCREN